MLHREQQIGFFRTNDLTYQSVRGCVCVQQQSEITTDRPRMCLPYGGNCRVVGHCLYMWRTTLPQTAIRSKSESSFASRAQPTNPDHNTNGFDPISYLFSIFLTTPSEELFVLCVFTRSSQEDDQYYVCVCVCLCTQHYFAIVMSQRLWVHHLRVAIHRPHYTTPFAPSGERKGVTHNLRNQDLSGMCRRGRRRRWLFRNYPEFPTKEWEGGFLTFRGVLFFRFVHGCLAVHVIFARHTGVLALVFGPR